MGKVPKYSRKLPSPWGRDRLGFIEKKITHQKIENEITPDKMKKRLGLS